MRFQGTNDRNESQRLRENLASKRAGESEEER